MSVRFPYKRNQVIGRFEEGLCVGLNLPEIAKPVKDKGGNEVAGLLPPYSPAEVFLVDEYELATKMWGESGSGELNYFVPVQAGKGLWLDFNSLYKNPFHAGVVVSIQGVNALTRLPAQSPALEQYKLNCPIHNIPFKHERYCSKCKYQVNAQNYLSSAATPEGEFWLDGFRTVNGEVRQFYFSEDEARGIASQVIKQKRSFSIGIALFLSKQPKPIQTSSRRSRVGVFNDGFIGGILNGESECIGGGDVTEGLEIIHMWKGHGNKSRPIYKVGSDSKGAKDLYKTISQVRRRGGPTLNASSEPGLLGSFEAESLKSVKNLEIAGGSKIKQMIYEDPNPIDFYQDEPSLVLHLNYCTVDVCEQILKGPKIDFSAGGEGALSGLLVGC